MTSPSPERCADVTFAMGDGSYGDLRPWDVGVGGLLWNPKGGEGHVLIAEVKCGEKMGVGQHPDRIANCGCDGWVAADCSAPTLVCECGEDASWRDHHYGALRKAPA